LISFEKVSFSYGEKKVLNNIDLYIEDGEFVGLIGGNGSGKSTLMKLINGILLPNLGTVMVDGMQTSDEQKLFEIRKNCGMVFQNPENQIIASTVEEDVAFGMENLGVPREEMEKRLCTVIDFVGLSGKRHRNPHTLSGGQKQRLAIASVLAMHPNHMVMDEPTSMLDPEGAYEVLEIYLRLKRDGKTVIVSSHNMEELIDCDRLIYIKNGKIFVQGKPKEIFKRLKNSEDIELTRRIRSKFNIN